MYKGKRIIAIIPARGGSKGLPNKNVLPLNGKPLIAWTIEQAKASKYLDRIIVSTEDRRIAAVARRYRAEVPFLRPRQLATDTASSIDVIRHAVSYFSDRADNYDYILLLEATSPLRDVADIDRCIKSLIDHQSGKSIVSVARHECTHYKFTISVDRRTGFIRNEFVDKIRIMRRQDLDDTYYFEGTIYLSEIATLFKTGTFYHNRTLPYVVPRWKAVEIDEFSDLICANALMKAKKLLQRKRG